MATESGGRKTPSPGSGLPEMLTKLANGSEPGDGSSKGLFGLRARLEPAMEILSQVREEVLSRFGRELVRQIEAVQEIVHEPFQDVAEF